jgi:hypothetical protein
MPTVNARQFRSISATFTRPNDTTAYGAADLVANSTTAASVVPLSWLTTGSRPFVISRILLRKSTASVTNAAFRIHIFSGLPTIATTGDNAAFATVVTGATTWLGSFDGTMAAAMADGAAVNCLPTGNYARRDCIGAPGTLYGLVEALGAYAPGAQEIFTITLFTEFDG